MLKINNLTIEFGTGDNKKVVVDNVSLNVKRGTSLGIVGESGSGKSVACYSMLGLTPMPPGKIESGSAKLAYFGTPLR